MRKGFTLVEIILYVGTLAIVLSSLSAFLLYIIDSKAKHIVMSDVEQQGNFLLTQISQTIRNAEGINSPAIGSADSSLSVDVLSAPLDPTIYSLSGTTMQITQGAGSAVDLNSDRVEVSAITFSHLGTGLGNEAIKIEFTVNYLNPDGRNILEYERNFQTTVSLR